MKKKFVFNTLKKYWILASLIILIICIFLLRPIFSVNGTLELSSLADISGKPISLIQGGIYDDMINACEEMPGKQDFRYYKLDIDCVQALIDGQVDAACITSPIIPSIVQENDNLMIFPQPVGKSEYAFGFPKGSPLLPEVNKAISDIKAEGEDLALEEKWYSDVGNLPDPIEQTWPGKRGVLRFWINSGPPPMAYINGDGEVVGYTVDYIMSIAKRLDYSVEITECTFDGLIPALVSGYADIAGRSMCVTEERKKSIDFSDSFMTEDQFLLVRKADVAANLQDISEDTSESADFFKDIGTHFTSTFIAENRWKLFCSGIGTTLLITVISALLGWFLGLFSYLLSCRGWKIFNRIQHAFNDFVSGVPVVVTLMVLYYVILGNTWLGGIGVSVVCFSLIFCITVFGLLDNGVNAIGKEQGESATALGFSKRQTFYKVIFPQAVYQIFPLLRARLIDHLKATAIVGYIAVQDLTKISDLIRCRTFDAFFPLIATALIYFALSKLINFAMIRFEKRLDPENRKGKMLKGVNVND